MHILCLLYLIVSLFSVVYLMIDIRRVKLLRRLAPGPYEDLIGPTVLSISLMLAIIVQFGLRLYDMLY